jgi:CRISPR-associated protein Csb3
MSHLDASLKVKVQVTNPGHFFACCGLLEIAHRIWPGAEGWFGEKSGFLLTAATTGTGPDIDGILLECLRHMQLSGLSDDEQKERQTLEQEKRTLKRQRKGLAEDKEVRLKQLGELARGGRLQVRAPDHASYAFSLDLDWWRGADEAVPKTWAGLQEVHKVARAAQDALSAAGETTSILDHACVLRLPAEYRRARTGRNDAVEPFYFDARRFGHALDVGFSLDAIGADTVAHPAVELLALIGLQRFRPKVVPSREPKVKAKNSPIQDEPEGGT